MDLRCESKKHAELLEERFLEIKCSSIFCGARRGVFVIHRWDLQTKTMTTKIYTNPPMRGNDD